MSETFVQELSFGPHLVGIGTESQTGVKRRLIQIGTSAAAFTPSSIPGLNIWIEADPTKLYTDAGATLVSADGNAVQQASDKSGNAHNVGAPASGQRPLYKTGGGKPFILFDGVDDDLEGTILLNLTDGSGQCWLAVAGYTINLAAQQYPVILRTNGGTTLLRIETTSAGLIRAVTDDGGAANSPTTPATASVPFSAIGELTTGLLALSVNGTSVGSTVLGSGLTSPTAIPFIGGAFAQFLSGGVYAVLSGSGILSAANRANLHTYLTALHP